MYHTTNDTTTVIGCATATVIADTMAERTGGRIMTLELVYPRIIHAEFLTHRVFSRNAASSRATPVATCLEEVERRPYVPSQWLKNKPGMAGGEPFGAEDAAAIASDIKLLRQMTTSVVRRLMERGVSKQQANRYLEPFMYIRTLVTATDWDNFFKLRLDKAHVQPEMYDLARAMRIAIDKSTSVVGRIHLPYIDWDVSGAVGDEDCVAAMISAARCARVSYLTHDGKAPDKEKDLALANRLWEEGHLSPFEHQAWAKFSPYYYSNFRGWSSARRYFSGRG